MYPKSSFAPKALYASGWIYENNLDMPDSAAAIYDSVVTKFPATAYANAIKAKLQVYKDEKKKEQAARDSVEAAKNNLSKPENKQQLNQSPQIADSLSNSPKTDNANVNQNNIRNTRPEQNVQPDSIQNNNRKNTPGQNTPVKKVPQEEPSEDTLKVRPREGPGALNYVAPKDSSGIKTQPKDSSDINNKAKKSGKIEK